MILAYSFFCSIHLINIRFSHLSWHCFLTIAQWDCGSVQNTVTAARSSSGMMDHRLCMRTGHQENPQLTEEWRSLTLQCVSCCGGKATMVGMITTVGWKTPLFVKRLSDLIWNADMFVSTFKFTKSDCEAIMFLSMFQRSGVYSINNDSVCLSVLPSVRLSILPSVRRHFSSDQ